MNFHWSDWIRMVCIGVLLPLLIFALLRVYVAEPGEAPPAAPKQPASIPQTQASCQIWVLTDGEKQQMELETYLVGVVLAEMPASFASEALRAQTVAARTYTLRHCKENPRHGDRTICTDHTCCQAYIAPEDYVSNGGSWSSVKRIEEAVHATADLVLMYENELILATYFSCAGGRTEDAAAVWGEQLPYLQSVASPGEEAATYYADSVSFTARQLQQALCVRLSGDVKTWFGQIEYTSGGGVDTIEIGGVSYRGTTIRTLLGLRSTAFSITISENTVTFHTRGYGHRVGMSQYGANAMALSGSSFRQILQHYYPGTQLQAYVD